MAIEEHSSAAGDGGGSGVNRGGANNTRVSKKLKQKKIPQRGLGVAQLERIRLEEQQKKDVSFQGASVVLSSSSSTKCLAEKFPTFRPTLNTSSISLAPPPSTIDNCVFRPNPSDSVIDSYRPKNSSNCLKLWSDEYSPERVNQKVNHNGEVFLPNVNVPCEPYTTPILPLPSVLQRSQQYQQPPSSSSMANTPTGISSSSVLNIQMEPPSNQSYYGCNYLPLWPEEVKMVGTKRPYPFSPDYQPAPVFHCKIPPCYIAPLSRSHESSSCSNGCTINGEAGNSLKREVPSKSRALSESKPSNALRDRKALDGDFLSLGPPTTTLPHLEERKQHSLTYSPPQRPGLFKSESFEPVACQGASAEPATRLGLSRSAQQPIFRFFPPAQVQNGQDETHRSNYRNEVGETVDLNLKL